MRTIHQGHLPIRTLVLIGMVILITAQAYAQNANARLTITLRNATLKEFVKLIENSTGYSFIYSEEISISHKINLKVKDMPLHEILDLVFKDEPISYKFSERYILLQKKRVQKPVSRKFTISGYVTDGTSSETLIGTNIIESHQYQGTTTNPYGFYSITLPEGETELRFSYLGYTTETHHFTLAQDTLLNIRMKGNAQLEEVVVVSDKAEAGTVATQMGAVEIPMVQIKNTPSILGESDVMKAIQLMPGVQAGVDGSAGLYIRGGSPDQNLILLDGTPVYNVDHMFGFFSVFTPEAIKKVTLFKSSFPARFGGRLSSVIDVRTNDGDMKKYHGTLSIGLLTSKINLEGPIVKDKTSFNISARRSYIDLIAKPFMPDDEKYNTEFYRKQIGTTGAGDLLSISANTKYPEASFEFAMWYLKGGMSPLVQGGRIPLWNGVNKDEVLSVLKEKAQGSIDMDSMENYLSLDTTQGVAAIKGHASSEISSAWFEEFDAMCYGKQSVDQTVQNMEKRGNELIQTELSSQK